MSMRQVLPLRERRRKFVYPRSVEVGTNSFRSGGSTSHQEVIRLSVEAMRLGVEGVSVIVRSEGASHRKRWS